MRLAALEIADPPERWTGLGFDVGENRVDLGGIAVRLGAEGEGITAWAIDGLEVDEIDGLAMIAALPPRGPVAHPNGATGIDHVVIASPDFDRTAAVLERTGLALRRIRDAGGFRQGFRRIGPAILELVEAAGPPGPARFWGLVVIVPDLEALEQRLGDRLGTIRPAVQPGRRIVTLRDSAGLSTRLAFMDPEGATLA